MRHLECQQEIDRGCKPAAMLVGTAYDVYPP